MPLSIIIPVLNEAALIDEALGRLQPLRREGHELVVVDGGSDDGTRTLAERWADQTLTSERGRAAQMNRGALASKGEILLFLHADTLLPDQALPLISAAIANRRGRWGRFDLRLSGEQPLFRLIERMINLRSRLTSIATGDQAIFIERALFFEIGGYPPLPLMEDLALSRRLRRSHRPICLSQQVTTSSRRWERQGAWRTIFLMWRLRAAYFCGADPAQLARRYANVR